MPYLHLAPFCFPFTSSEIAHLQACALCCSFCTSCHSNGIDGHLKDLGKRGCLKEVIGLLQYLNRYKIYASPGTYVCLLQECIYFKAFPEGKHLHANIQKNGLVLDVSLGNMLITMYIKYYDMTEAALVFEGMSERNVFTWTLMIGGYTKLGYACEPFTLFWRMISEQSEKPNKFTFLAILKACFTLDQGKQVHLCIVRFNLDSDNFLRSALIDMYSRCGSVELARELFDKVTDHDVVTWNSIISSYVQHGHSMGAVTLFIQLQQEGMEPDEVTLISVVKACTSLGALKQGKFVHCFANEKSPKLSVSVQNALIDMYAKCGSLASAASVFSEILQPNVISWTAMLAACTQHGFSEQALEYFWQMWMENVMPDDVAYVSVMKACANMAALESGKQVHTCMLKQGLKLCTFLENTLIDMYAKCGSMDFAYCIFDNMCERDLISWSAMVSGFALHGSPMEAFQLVKRMQHLGMELDKIMFIGVLSACSHAGWINEGLYCFTTMCQDHGLTPTAEHYSCIVDMLTRAGRLEQAYEFIHEADCPCGEEIWTAVLASCRIFGEVTMAKYAAQRLLELQPQNTAAFVLLSNIYAEAGRWEERAMVRNLMQERWAAKA